MKRVLFCGDLHCGHRVGLTPPLWQRDTDKYTRQATKLWELFAAKINELRPFDIAIYNGDLIDGKGYRSGATEQIESDRHKQAGMATFVLEWVGAKENQIIRGTPYHTGTNEDFEDVVARNMDCDIGDHEWFDIEGVVFDVKHKIGGSYLPQTRGNALATERLHNLMWHTKKGAPLADIYIRSHVHYYAQRREEDWVGIILPALQGLGSKFGKRQCGGTVDWGFCWADINDGEVDMHEYIDGSDIQQITTKVL